jgi:hypothetical protein
MKWVQTKRFRKGVMLMAGKYAGAMQVGCGISKGTGTAVEGNWTLGRKAGQRSTCSSRKEEETSRRKRVHQSRTAGCPEKKQVGHCSRLVILEKCVRRALNRTGSCRWCYLLAPCLALSVHGVLIAVSPVYLYFAGGPGMH